MKKLTKLLFLLIIGLSFASCFKKVTESEARIILHKHLEERYGEPFHISYMGRRGYNNRVWYEAEILPSRYLGTARQSDKYYWSTGTARIVRKWYGEDLSPGDIYMAVRLNEDANDYFRPKLKEIFGDMVLPVLDINVHVVKGNGDFLETVEFASREGTTREQKGQGEGAGFDITGGIYIWGRIDDLEEKEAYREKIFEFIDFMKSRNMFTHVDLAFYILDERSLTERFDNEVGDKLVSARGEINTADEFIAYRRGEMETLEEEYDAMTDYEKLKRIERYNRMKLRDTWGNNDMRNKLNKYSFIYHRGIYSRNFLEVELRLRHIKKIDYDELEDIKLLNTMKIDYSEYVREKLHNNEWDGE